MNILIFNMHACKNMLTFKTVLNMITREVITKYDYYHFGLVLITKHLQNIK